VLKYLQKLYFIRHFEVIQADSSEL